MIKLKRREFEISRKFDKGGFLIPNGKQTVKGLVIMGLGIHNNGAWFVVTHIASGYALKFCDKQGEARQIVEKIKNLGLADVDLDTIRANTDNLRKIGVGYNQ